MEGFVTEISKVDASDCMAPMLKLLAYLEDPRFSSNIKTLCAVPIIMSFLTGMPEPIMSSFGAGSIISTPSAS